MQIKYEKEIIDEKSIFDELLRIRGIKDVESFLNPPHPKTISLFQFKGASKNKFNSVIKTLKKIKENKKSIVVYTDYDADGITGGAILWETLYKMGFNVMPYVPDRIKEGYGFSKQGIDKVISQYHPSLIISVDHGITARKEVEYAAKKGVKIIITDHHLKPKSIPEKALAIFHLPELSGSGVSYFFSKEVFNTLDGKTSELIKNFQTDYALLASIGTIADIVPLVGGSRSIAKYGLKAFRDTKRIGIKKLLKEAGIEQNREITPYEIGFIIAPRINAVGRLQNAIDALRLLCTPSELRAKKLASLLNENNRLRQNLVKKAIEEALDQISNKYGEDPPPIILLESKVWHEGIIGLIAAKIVEKYYRPTLVLTKSDGYYKASGRSIPKFHLTNFLRKFEDMFISVGGHAQAAGFSIKENELNAFKSKLKAESQHIDKKILKKVIKSDLKVKLNFITKELVSKLERLRPFGMGNKRPTFYSTARIKNAKLFGRENNHLRLSLEEGGKLLEGIYFGGKDLFYKLGREENIEVVYTPEINRWNNNEKIQLKISYIKTKNNL